MCSMQNVATPSCGWTGARYDCTSTCKPGFGDCDGDKFTNGCETHLPYNDSNCGVCGRRCNVITSRCVPSGGGYACLLFNGESCTRWSQCISGACSGGVCAPF
jgi:hypothetical protein